MASLLLKLAEGLTPPQNTLVDDYDGIEWRWKMFVFRPALFKLQAYLLVAVLGYVAIALFGKYTNTRRVHKWYNIHLPIFEQQFSKPTTATGLISDGYTDFFNFSTGRVGIASLHTIFTLRPRQDFLQMLYQFGWQMYDLRYNPYDELILDFKLSPDSGLPDFVWAVVAKDELYCIKNTRWDLTFTKTTDNPALPSSLSVMSEFADITDSLVKAAEKSAIFKLLSDPSTLKHFRSLSITDQPRERPALPLAPAEREKRVILSLKVPATSDTADTIPIVNAIFAFVDALSRVSLRPETKNKLRKVREDVDKEIVAEAVKEKKEEAVEEKKAAKRKAEQDRISRLSAAEQKKILERDRKRALKKSQGKVVRK